MKMRNYGLSEERVCRIHLTMELLKNKVGNKDIKKYSTYEVGGYYIVDSKKYKMLSVWKINRR